MRKRSLDVQGLQERVRRFLRSRGPSTSAALLAELGVSQSSLSRIIQSLSGEVVMAGRGKATCYAASRTLPGLPPSLPIYEILPDGTSRHLGLLFSVEPGEFLFAPAKGVVGNILRSRDLPFFLQDLRPAGFLGRLVPYLNKDLRLPEDIRNWSIETTLEYLSSRAWDCIGNLIVGEKAFQLFLERLKPGQKSRPDAAKYESIAADIMSHGVPGSSAAGEQPKFLQPNGTQRGAVMVKFSPPVVESPVARRIADLLVCEHIALQTLAEFGVNTAKTSLIVGPKRHFLEIERFDRLEHMGRRGVVSLGALDAEFVGLSRSWTSSAQALHSHKVITAKHLELIRKFELFGNLIGNTDMHLFNISFFSVGAGTVSDLAPVYDMTPALFAPRASQLVDVDFAPPLPSPSSGDIWPDAFQWALSFWERVSIDKRISVGFRTIAATTLQKTRALERVGRHLPHATPQSI